MIFYERRSEMRKTELEMSVSKIEMKCMSCGQMVKAKLIKFGDGFIAVCPVCKQLAYNVKFKDATNEASFFKKNIVRAVVIRKMVQKKKKDKKRKKKRNGRN